eukprot:2932342-Amphidinium_carterae.1
MFVSRAEQARSITLKTCPKAVPIWVTTVIVVKKRPSLRSIVQARVSSCYNIRTTRDQLTSPRINIARVHARMRLLARSLLHNAACTLTVHTASPHYE